MGERIRSGAIAIRSLSVGHAFCSTKTAWVGLILATFLLVSTCTIDKDAGIPTDFEIVLFENADHPKGEILRLSHFHGQPVVLNFWFPSCPPCVAEMPEFEIAYQTHKPQGVEFLGVQMLGLDTVEEGQAFVKELGVNYAIGPDTEGEIIRGYAVAGFPTTVFLDRDLNIVRQWTGMLDSEKLEEFIQELLN